MKSVLWLIAAIFASGLAQAESFQAEMPVMCGPTVNLEANLQNEYGEKQMFKSNGLNDDGGVIVHSFWYNQNTTTWSFIVSNIDAKVSCVLATGEKLLFNPSGAQT